MAGDRHDENPFLFLEEVNPALLAGLLQKEKVLLSGIVLSNLSPAAAAKVLANMRADLQREVLDAMRKARTLPGEGIRQIAQALRKKVDAAGLTEEDASAAPAACPPPQTWEPRSVTPKRELPPEKKGLREWTPPRVDEAAHAPESKSKRDAAMRAALDAIQSRHAPAPPPPATTPAPPSGTGGRHIDGMAIMGEILRHVSPEVRRHLREEAPGLYGELRARMFVFDDLALMPGKGLAQVFSGVDLQTAALSLRFAAPALSERVLAALPERISQQISEEQELNRGQRVRIADVEAAQQRVLDVALALQQAGKVLIDPNDPDLLE